MLDGIKLTLYKQTEIEIDMSRFIEHILKLYRSKRPLGDGYTFNNEIAYTIERMTLCDPYDYDNAFWTMLTVMKNAVVHATEWNYPQTDIDMLNEIIDLM